MLSIIAAIGKNRELGKDNKLLWHVSEDLKRFRAITTGHPVIMGRKTYESTGRPLPNRVNIVISKQIKKIDGVTVVDSIDFAMDVAKKSIGSEEIFVIGGARIYEQFINRADRLYLTLVEKEYPSADVFFPPYRAFESVVSKKPHLKGSLGYTYIILDKIKGSTPLITPLISAKVIKGAGRGKNLGFPTFNMKIPKNLNLKPGVYACWVWLGSNAHKWKGALHYGSIPTFGQDKYSLEVYLLELNEDILPSSATIETVKYIRGIKSFRTQKELIKQISIDVEQIQSLLSKDCP